MRPVFAYPRRRPGASASATRYGADEMGSSLLVTHRATDWHVTRMSACVAAVVPTLNRKAALVRCIERLFSQTHPLETIFVVDNSSSDDTVDTLAARGWIPSASVVDEGYTVHSGTPSPRGTKMVLVRMANNAGSMGGFDEGMRRAYASAHDWIWLVDDDSEPASECLERLIRREAHGSLLGPIALSKKESDELSFEVWDEVHETKITSLKQAAELNPDGVIVGDVCPFHGCLLINRDVVAGIGSIMGEMFHWGGEVEYAMRARAHGFRTATVIDATNYHKKYDVESVGLFLGKTAELPKGKLGSYCYYRNMAYVVNRYYGKIQLAKWLLKYAWVFLVHNRMDIRGLILYGKATIDGLRGVWGKERAFLGGG